MALAFVPDKTGNTEMNFDKISALAGILDQQKAGMDQIHNTVEKSVVPLLVAIEKNTRTGFGFSGGSGVKAKNVIPFKGKKENKSFGQEKTSLNPPKKRESASIGNAPAMLEKPAPNTNITQLGKIQTVKNIQPTENLSSLLEKNEQVEKGVIKKKEKNQTEAPKEAKSKEALEKQREQKNKDDEKEGFKSSIKDALSGWDGSLFSNPLKSNDDIEDAAGSASFGAAWGAIAEIKDVMGKFGEASSDDSSLLGILKNKVKDKTGISAVQNKISDVKGRAVENLTGKTPEKEALPEGVKRNKAGKLVDSKGKFVSDPVKASIPKKESSAKRSKKPEKMSVQSGTALSLPDLKEGTDKQIEALEKINETLVKNESESEKRNDELKGAIASSSGGSNSGLLGGAMSLLGGGKKGGMLGKVTSKMGGFGGKLGKLGKLGKVGKLAGLAGGLGGMLGFGSLLGGGSQDSTSTDLASEVASNSVQSKIEKKASSKAVSKIGTEATEKGVTKLGTKGLAKGTAKVGSKALRALGPIASIALAGYDAYSGFNDKQMQAEAFGLKDGQEATLGQKSAGALANVLDMGGLVSGGLSMLGMDTSTADIAKGIYGFFGGGKDKKKEVEQAQKAEIEKPALADPVSAKTIIEESNKGSVTEKTSSDGSFDKLSKQIEKLANMLAGEKKASLATATAGGSRPAPNIKTDFDDTTLILMSRDRI